MHCQTSVAEHKLAFGLPRMDFPSVLLCLYIYIYIYTHVIYIDTLTYISNIYVTYVCLYICMYILLIIPLFYCEINPTFYLMNI